MHRHLGFTKWAHTPTFRGFESFYGFYSGGEDYFAHNPGAYDFHQEEGERCGANCSQSLWSAKGNYSTTLFAQEAVRRVEAHDTSIADEPLFLYLAFQAVHSPGEVPQSYKDAYNGSIVDSHRLTFAGMLSCLDEGLGNVTTALADKGMLNDTLVIFTTDNGGPVPDTPGGDYVGSRNYPLRGGKHSIWEGGTRGTAFVHSASRALLPDMARRGIESNNLMHASDWFPTLCRVASLRCDDLPFDGSDQWDAIASGAPSPRQEVLYGRHDDAPEKSSPYDDAIRDADGWKLIYGWGGKPSTITKPVIASVAFRPEACTARNCYSNADIQSCSMALQAGVCMPGNDLDSFPAADVSECCTACEGNATCAAFTANNKSGSLTCYLKQSAPSKPTKGDGCISAAKTSAPTPPPAPTPRPMLLFNVAIGADESESNEVAAAHPDIVTRLSERLDELLATSIDVPGGGNTADPSCKHSGSWPSDAEHGTFFAPWCN